MLDQVEALDEVDLIEVRDLIAEHERRTGSPVARRILEDWAELQRRFVKIFPTDYKRVLADLAAQEAAAQPPRADEFAGDSADVTGEPHVRTGDGE
jgi:glutamate synthase domain-containing protein 3